MSTPIERLQNYLEQAVQNWTRPPAPAAAPTNNMIASARKLMEAHTWEQVKRLCNSIHPPLFILSQDQTRTLNSLPIPRELAQAVQDLSHLFIPTQDYPLVQRLKSIATIAPTGPEPNDRPSWSQWWLSQPAQKAGIPRPQDHDPLKEPEHQALNQVIAAMTAQALQDLPTDQEILAHLQQEAQAEKSGARRSPGPIPLSRIIARNEIMRNTAPYFLSSRESFDQAVAEADPDRSFLKNQANPDLILARLQEMGQQAEPDCGLKTDLHQLREAIRKHGFDSIDVNHANPYWVLQKNSQQLNSVLRNDRNVIKVGGPDNAVNHRSDQYELSPNEQHLVYITAPRDPTEGMPDRHPENPAQQTANLALLHRTTPEKMYRFLTGQDPDLKRPPPELCPQRANCPTRCALHQRESEDGPNPGRPLTVDGQPDSCPYFAFRQQNSHTSPALREQNAGIQLEIIAKRHKARTRQLQRDYQDEPEAADNDPPEPTRADPDAAATGPKGKAQIEQLSFL